jgi:hypothetical protein
MGFSIQMKINENLFIKDPQETKLGKRIIQQGIVTIDEIGFEQFTFKKLAERINSTEASIYRYFENKHLFLVYLLCWYWEWMMFAIELNTMNVTNPVKKLKIAISSIVATTKRNTSIDFVDEDILHKIVVAESTKTYHTKQIEKENDQGFFKTYKLLNKKLAGFIAEINPQFKYPRALASTILEMANTHIYFAIHLPSMTDVTVENGDLSQIEQLLWDFTKANLNFQPPPSDN